MRNACSYSSRPYSVRDEQRRLDVAAVDRADDHRELVVVPGFPDRDGVIERYASASGRDVGDLLWYEALALWKGAIFLEGSYGRMLNGTTDDPFFAELERGVPELAAPAWELAQRAGATR